MKRTALILAALALTLGFVSCDKGNKVTNEEVTAVIVEPAMITLTLGETETAKLDVKWTPSTVKATAEFTSEKPEVATVSKDGEVKAVAKGTTTITVKVGTKSATATVLVVEKGGNTPQEGATQLPIFRYKGDQATAKEIVKHEAEVGRQYTEKILVQLPKFRTAAFVSDKLDIFPVTAYGLSSGNNKAIVALGKEPIDNCEKTLDMLRKGGFANAKIVTENGKNYIFGNAKSDIGDNITLMGHEQKIVNTKGQPDTNTFIAFFYEAPLPPAKAFHATIADAKDFPYLGMPLATDEAKIKEYEEKLGLRTFSPDKENPTSKNLFFKVSEATLAKTNFQAVYYAGAPAESPTFINSFLASIRTVDDFDTPEFKSWLKVNGFDTDVTFDGRVITAYNKDKSICAQAYLKKASEPDKNGKEYSFAMMQLVESKHLKSTSLEEIRTMADKSFDKIFSQEEQSFESILSKQLKRR